MSAPQHLFTLFLALTAAAVRAQSGSGVTTRYWDCCKTSCAWNGKAAVTAPVESCDINNNPLTGANAANLASGCGGGTAFACADNQPWAVSDTLAYGYAAVALAEETEADWCCSCYQLTFTSGAVSGKTMIVQASNTGSDVAGDQFDLMIPGGGQGIFSGCAAQYSSISASAWGAQYGGVTSVEQCSGLPTALQAGCNFRFGWFGGSDNPTVDWKKVTCPAALTANSGCVRTAEGTVSGTGVVDAGATSDTASEESLGNSIASITSHVSTPSTTSTVSKMATVSTVSTVTTPVSTMTGTPHIPANGATASDASVAADDIGASAAAVTVGAPGRDEPASLDVASRYHQCGGIGWTGASTCEAPYTCVAQTGNPYYSQCL